MQSLRSIKKSIPVPPLGWQASPIRLRRQIRATVKKHFPDARSTVPRSLVFAHHAVFMAKLWIKSHPYDNQQLAISEPRKSG